MTEFLTDNNFERFRSLIYEASGIHFSAANRSILENRLRERVRASAATTIEDYFDAIRADDAELKSLLDSVTTNLTRFFRNTAHVQTFEYYVIPELVRIKRPTASTTIRLWSAGCSTGEEPYTFAMILRQVLPPGYTAEIIASDLSLKSLMTGQEGFYPEHRVTDVPEKYLSRYFERKPAGYRIKDEIRRMVRFDYHNLKHDSGLRDIDVVICRNVLIYFDEAAQKAAVDRFWEALAPRSFLFVGHSESLFGMNTGFEFLRTDWACIYRKNVAGEP